MAAASASSSPLTLMIGTTGPKSSSRAIAMSLVASTNTCGGKTSPCGSPPSTWRAPSAGAFRCAPGASQLLLVDQRADHGVGVARVADFQPADPVGEALDEFVVDLRVDDQPVDRHADLALVQKLAEDGRVDREVQVGVVEDHRRTVPAELEDHALLSIGLCAASSMMRRPTSVEPVNEITRGIGWRTKASPITLPWATITLSTPAEDPPPRRSWRAGVRR